MSPTRYTFCFFTPSRARLRLAPSFCTTLLPGFNSLSSLKLSLFSTHFPHAQGSFPFLTPHFFRYTFLVNFQTPPHHGPPHLRSFSFHNTFVEITISFANNFLRSFMTNYRTHSTLLIGTLNVTYEVHFLLFHPFSRTTSARPKFVYNLVARIK